MRYAIQVLVLSAVAASVVVAPAFAQAPDKTKRVGYVVYGNSGVRSHLEQAFLDGMRDRGYVEGKNLVVERRFAEGSVERLREGASELAALKLDAIVATCSPSTNAVKQATGTSGTPIVMANVSDPVGQGLIASLARPGGSITGRSSQADETLPKMLELFSAVLPKSTRVAVLHNTRNPVHPTLWRELSQAGKGLDIALVRIDVAGPKDFPAAFETIARERLGALLLLPDDNMTMNWRARIVELATAHRIPTMYGVREFVAAGGLMSYGENYAVSYRRTAGYVEKVLAGAKPADLPVEQPTQFEFVVNLKTAKALGITIPQSLLVKADEVIR
jgi:putative ABC transport system substrate-binding protein